LGQGPIERGKIRRRWRANVEYEGSRKLAGVDICLSGV